MGSSAAQQIHFVCAGCCDQQIRILNTCLTQHMHGSAVAVHRHNIIALHAVFQHLRIQIDQGDVTALGGKLTGQGSAYLAVACNDNIHSILPFQKNFSLLYQSFLQMTTPFW